MEGRWLVEISKLTMATDHFYLQTIVQICCNYKNMIWFFSSSTYLTNVKVIGSINYLSIRIIPNIRFLSEIANICVNDEGEVCLLLLVAKKVFIIPDI